MTVQTSGQIQMIYSVDENLAPVKVEVRRSMRLIWVRSGAILYMTGRRMKLNGFDWWKRRMQHSSKLYDVIRINNHFIGIVKYYTIPQECQLKQPTTSRGREQLLDVINEAIGSKKIIARI